MDIKTFIQDFANNTKKYIEKFEEYKELTGEQKKQRLDEIIEDYVEVALDSVNMNVVLKFVFKKVLLANVPVITQIIFDLIAARIKGITK